MGRPGGASVRICQRETNKIQVNTNTSGSIRSITNRIAGPDWQSILNTDAINTVCIEYMLFYSRWIRCIEVYW